MRQHLFFPVCPRNWGQHWRGRPGRTDSEPGAAPGVMVLPLATVFAMRLVAATVARSGFIAFTFGSACADAKKRKTRKIGKKKLYPGISFVRTRLRLERTAEKLTFGVKTKTEERVFVKRVSVCTRRQHLASMLADEL